MESWVQSWRPRANAFCDISTPVSKVLRLPRRSEARSYEVLHLSRKIIFPKLKIWCSKMQHFSGNQRPDPNISDEHVSCTAPATENVSLQILFKCPTPATVLKCYKILTFCWLLTKYRIPCTCHARTTSEHQKVFRTRQFFYTFDFEMCFAPQPRAFFDMSTSKSGLSMVCFVYFDLEMCFAPQRRALFRHLTCQKWSAPLVFCTFWLVNVLRATTACTFSTCQLPNVVRCWCVLYLYILTWKRPSHHNGMHFFDMSTSKSAPILRCFVHFDFQLCFAPQMACNFSSLIWPHGSAPTAYFSTLWSHKSLKNTVFRDFPTFSRTWIFFLLRLSLFWFFLLHFSSLLFSHLPFSCLTLPISAFHLWRLSEVWLLNFLRSNCWACSWGWNPSQPGAAFSPICRAFICSTDDYFTKVDDEGGGKGKMVKRGRSGWSGRSCGMWLPWPFLLYVFLLNRCRLNNV